MNGDVIGINTAILGRNGSIGIGFSIPSNSAKIVIDQLIEFGETKRGWLGVRIQDVTKEIAEVEKLDEPRGALVASVAPNSPSEKAGVKSGDIILEFNGEKKFKAKVIGADPLSDIAVLQLETNEKFLPVKFGDSDKARIGDWVIAIGNPFGLGGTVTSGIISARNRFIGLSRYEDYIQTDASINSGNSGGPLFDMNGDVIGINTAILGRSGNVGIGFSIPSNSAKIVIDQLIEFGETKRGWLGVRIQDVTKEIAEVEKLDEPRGALVASVAPNSPSEKAGVKSGDIILEFNGEKIKQMKELPIIVARTEVGKKVKVKIWRNKKEIIKTITLGRLETSEDFKISEKKEELPKETLIENLKIKVRKLSDQDIKTRNLPNQTNGLVITSIEKNSPLTGSIEVNSIILEAQKKKIRTVQDLNQALKQVLNSNQKTILLVIYNSQNQKRYIGVKLDWLGKFLVLIS